jgi:hypothetical protein
MDLHDADEIEDLAVEIANNRDWTDKVENNGFVGKQGLGIMTEGHDIV